jgi:general stress protein CsbA
MGSFWEEHVAYRTKVRKQESAWAKERIADIVGMTRLAKFWLFLDSIAVFILLLIVLAVGIYLGWTSSPWFIWILVFCLGLAFLNPIVTYLEAESEKNNIRFKHLAEQQEGLHQQFLAYFDQINDKLQTAIETASTKPQDERSPADP